MRILSVNLGSRRPVTVKSRTLETGIFKIPASGPVAVGRLGLQDDVLVEPRTMGREHSAVYAYPFEHYAYWQDRLQREPFPLGQFGENLTVTGLLEDEVRIGDIFRFGDTLLQVAHPRIPCGKLNARMGLRFAPMFLASCKVGYYMRVLQEGRVARDDTIELLERDEHSPTMEEFVRVTQFEYWDTQALQALLHARDLMPAWREIIASKLTRSQAADGWHGLREFRVARREQESEDTVSLDLECVRGRALAPFHGGQQLMVVVGERGESASQVRKHCYLSGNPQDRSVYRITLRHKTADDPAQPDCIASARLFSLEVGDHVLCNAPYSTVRSEPEAARPDRIPVLISQGLGVAPMLSLLYELERLQMGARLFHEADANEPQSLLNEVAALVARHSGFEQVVAASGDADRLRAEQIRAQLPAGQLDIQIAGSRAFIERMTVEFAALDIAPGALIMHTID